jgi:hypothetical protein
MKGTGGLKEKDIEAGDLGSDLFYDEVRSLFAATISP